VLSLGTRLHLYSFTSEQTSFDTRCSTILCNYSCITQSARQRTLARVCRTFDCKHECTPTVVYSAVCYWSLPDLCLSQSSGNTVTNNDEDLSAETLVRYVRNVVLLYRNILASFPGLPRKLSEMFSEMFSEMLSEGKL